MLRWNNTSSPPGEAGLYALALYTPVLEEVLSTRPRSSLAIEVPYLGTKGSHHCGPIAPLSVYAVLADFARAPLTRPTPCLHIVMKSTG